jgi:hypothetical protein
MPTHWRAALGRDCGNGGVLLIRAHLSQIPEEWQQIAVRLGRANGIRNGDKG